MNALIQSLLPGSESRTSGMNPKSDASQNQLPEFVAFAEVLNGVNVDESPRTPIPTVAFSREQAGAQTGTGDTKDRPAGDVAERSQPGDPSLNPNTSVFLAPSLSVIATQPPISGEGSQSSSATPANTVVSVLKAERPGTHGSNLHDAKEKEGAADRLDPESTFDSAKEYRRGAADATRSTAAKSWSPTQSGYSADDVPSPPLKVTVKSLQTHLIAAVSEFSAQTQNAHTQSERSRDASAHVDPVGSLAQYSSRSLVKIITIELAPASLGQITAKMRFSGSGLALELSVDTPEARRALRDVEESLVEAIQASGGKVESCEIKISSAQGSADTMPASSQKHDASIAFENRSSANDAFLDSFNRRGDRQSGRGFPDETEKSLRHSGDRESASPINVSTGVYL
jgi:hypothetical protein